MIQRQIQNKRLSQVVLYKGTFETAGLVAQDASSDITLQTEQVLAEIEKLAALVGGSKNDLVRIQIWLSDMQDYDAMNVVYERWLDGFEKPVRACVESKLASSQYLVEMQAFGCIHKE